MAASINYPGTLDGDAQVGGGNEPDGATALDDNTSGHPKHSVLHQNIGEAIQKLEEKVGAGAATPSANNVLVADGVNSTWGKITADMIASGQSPTFTTVTATDITLGGQDLGEIQTFEPSYTNTSGFESNQGYYAYVKDLVYVSIETEFNASYSVGDTRVDLPVAGADIHQASNAMLQVQLFDYSENKFYQGMATPVDSNTIQVRRVAVEGSNLIGGPTSSTLPFEWNDGDKILITGFYRVGS
jgi:hypothetical protein